MDKNETLEDLFGERPYQTLVQEIKDFAIIHLDIRGNILSWNKGAESIFGFTEDEIKGHNFSLLFTPADKSRDIPKKELNKAKEVGRSEDVRWHLQRDGSRVFVNSLTTALLGKDGSLKGYAKIARDDTELRQVEEALEKSNQRSNNILESIADAFFTLDKDWRFTYLNKQSEPLLRRTREELLGKSIWEEFPEAVDTSFYEQYHKASTEQRAVTFEDFYPPLDTWFEVRAYPSPAGLSVYFHNINERVERRSLESLNGEIGNALIQDSDLQSLLNQCAESLVKHLNAAFARIWTLNEDEKILEPQASAGMYAHLNGANSQVPIGEFKIGLIAKERQPHLTNDVLNDSRLNDKEWAEREGMKSFAGYPLIVEDRLVGVMCIFAKHSLSEATLAAMASVSKGIANAIERKQVENALRQSEEQYRLVTETASDVIISINQESTILFVNRAVKRVFGYEIEQIVGQNLAMLMPDYMRELHKIGQQRYIETGEKHLQWQHVEVPGLRRNGHEFPLELSFAEYKKNNRHIFIGVARDISERKQAEVLLRESEQKFSTLAEVVPQLVWMADADGSIFWYNRNWFDYTGTTSEDMKGWGWQSVHDPKMLSSVTERWKSSIENGNPFEMEFPLRGADGQFRWFLTRVNPLRDAEGQIIRWFGTNTDIDEQRRLNLRNQFVIQLDEAVRSLETTEEITLTLARLLGEYLGADRCAYAEVEADENNFYILGDYTRGELGSLAGHYKMSQFGAEVLRLMRENQPYVVDDVDNDERVTKENLEAYRQTEVQAVICIPLQKNGRFSACMSVNQKTPRRWLPEEVELVTFIASRFWESIERAKAIKSLHESLAREQEARQTAEQANKIKDEFLATVSHELRTPLNAILGWSSLLRSGKLDGETANRAIETVERNACSQSQLIDDLLDISRIITGKLRLEIRTIELSKAIEAAIDAVRPAAEAKDIRVQILLDTESGWVSGDADRLQQVFWNLLSNAVKFTPKGGRVQVRLERVNSHVEITVSDNGKGIEPEFLPHVFDRFRQADQTTTRRQGGLGLGLSIVRQLVEMHGGTVYAESEGAGKGTSFVVNLPRLIAARGREKESEKRVHPTVSEEFISIDCAPELSGLRILVVDDEPDARTLLREILEMRGSEVTAANSSSAALDALEGGAFDVLVSDIGMPDEDGYTLIKKVRSLTKEKGGRIPAIALTAYARVEDRVRALTTGFQAHVPKPVEPVELVAVVASLARNHGEI